MKVYSINYSDQRGGAARAAYRIHSAVRQYGVDSTLFVNDRRSMDPSVRGPRWKGSIPFNYARERAARVCLKFLGSSSVNYESLAMTPTNWSGFLNSSPADVIHLHWINGEMMSVADVGRVSKPIVWTFHDMWPFCGTEHYPDHCRWRDGYLSDDRLTACPGPDVSKAVWERKKCLWKSKISIVTPSEWLAKCVRSSALMYDWPVRVVPNTLDTQFWRPVDSSAARVLFGLPQDCPLVLFGAMGGHLDPRKGFHLLIEALKLLESSSATKGIELVVFGASAPGKKWDIGFPAHFVGSVNDDEALRALYSAVDLFLLPSMQDNLPNTGLESLSCGTPVVGFNAGGIPDIILHRYNGYLAESFCPEDFASGIIWSLDGVRTKALSEAARQSAVRRYSLGVVARKYVEVYSASI